MSTTERRKQRRRERAEVVAVLKGHYGYSADQARVAMKRVGRLKQCPYCEQAFTSVVELAQHHVYANHCNTILYHEGVSWRAGLRAGENYYCDCGQRLAPHNLFIAIVAHWATCEDIDHHFAVCRFRQAAAVRAG